MKISLLLWSYRKIYGEITGNAIAKILRFTTILRNNVKIFAMELPGISP